MKTRLQISTAITCLFLIASIGAVHGEERHLLMVTDKNNDILSLNKQELRRLFLGMPVYSKGHKLKPIINRSEEMCYQIFLQYILGMSHKRYVRTMLSRPNQSDTENPPVFYDVSKVASYLHKEPYSITYIYKHNLPKFNNLKVMQEIWVSKAP